MATLNYNNVSMEIPIPSNYTNNTGYISQLPYTAENIGNQNFVSDYSGKLMSAIEINWGNAHSTGHQNFPSYINSSLDIVAGMSYLNSKTINQGNLISTNYADIHQLFDNIDDINTNISDNYETLNNYINNVKNEVYNTHFEYQYFTIESLEDNNEIYWLSQRDVTDYIFISTDADVWLEKNVSNVNNVNDQIPIIKLNKGDKLFIRRIYNINHATLQLNSYFSSSKNFIVYGNIMSLFYGEDFIGKYDFLQKRQNISIVNSNNENSESLYNIFSYLFANCRTLINAENLILPATILQYGCYARMFAGCRNLEKAPKLPATTLAQYCYEAMFNNCTSLTKSPELPATTLSNNCYENMFGGCTSLIKAPELPAITLAQSCYADMFYGCKSLTKAPELPATTLAKNCYYQMFYGCTSLTKAPELPATTLVEGCYSHMFNGCTKLNFIKMTALQFLDENNNEHYLYEDTAANTLNMFAHNTAYNGIFVKNDYFPHKSDELTYDIPVARNPVYIGRPENWKDLTNLEYYDQNSNSYIYYDQNYYFNIYNFDYKINQLTEALTYLLNATETIGGSNAVASAYLNSVRGRIYDMQLAYVHPIGINDHPLTPGFNPAPGFDGGNGDNGGN